MQNRARQNYVLAEVQTATPQKLQLLLVEAAIKNIHRTKAAWEQEKFDVGFETLSKAQDIVAEILSSLDRKNNPDLAGKIASIYVFIFRSMSEAGMTHNPVKLDDALRILNSERETWRQVCEKFGSSLASVESVTPAAGSLSGIGSTAAGATKTVTTQSGTLSLSSPSAVLVPQNDAPPKTIKTAAYKTAAGGASKSWDV
ncbi:MAG: flagellar export chaperone FliS [Planctomycetaceae bacterium]|jgi:flagellar protein FliS|nr:flagellar export chaperone FliS [Planctomycetaceae bacterium]